jgi:hypothetical protein
MYFLFQHYFIKKLFSELSFIVNLNFFFHDQSLNTSCLGIYSTKIKTIRGQVMLEHIPLSKLEIGLNANKVVCGRVVCVVYSQEPVP